MNIALIVMAGKGERMGLNVPKQFFVYKDRPLYFYTVSKFNSHPKIDRIVLVTSKEYVNKVKEEIKSFNFYKVSDVICGGDTRHDSVENGLNALKDGNDIVLIHDALRVFINNDIISENISACKKHDAVVTAVKEVNSISVIKDGVIDNEIDRENIYIHQTPQTFRVSLIKDAYNHLNNYTDEANFVASLNKKVFIVEGSYSNIKITTKEDLNLLSKLV